MSKVNLSCPIYDEKYSEVVSQKKPEISKGSSSKFQKIKNIFCCLLPSQQTSKKKLTEHSAGIVVKQEKMEDVDGTNGSSWTTPKYVLNNQSCKLLFHCFEEETKMRGIIKHIKWVGKKIWEKENSVCFLFKDNFIEFHMNQDPIDSNSFSTDFDVNIVLTDNNDESRIASTTEFLRSNNFPNHTRSVLAIHKHTPVPVNVEFERIVRQNLDAKTNWSFQYYDSLSQSGEFSCALIEDMINIANNRQ